MGHGESKQENMFLSVFKHMMAERILKVSEKALKDFLDFIKKVSPWFLVEGTLTLSLCLYLSVIKQGNEETYQEFFSRLKEAIHRMLPQSEGTEILLKQLAWENANTLCQDLIRPIKKTGIIQDFIKACVDASPAVVQGMPFAAAMKGQTYSTYVKKTYGVGRGSSNPTCFQCGKAGHIQRASLGRKELERR